MSMTCNQGKQTFAKNLRKPIEGIMKILYTENDKG